MKKIVYHFLCFLLFLSACTTQKPFDSDLTYFDDYPEVIDILDYLEVAEDDYQYILKENGHFIVCLPDEGSSGLNDYLSSMEKNGFEVKNYSATVWTIDVLTKDSYEINISSVLCSHLDEWISYREEPDIYQTLQDQDFDSTFILIFELTQTK